MTKTGVETDDESDRINEVLSSFNIENEMEAYLILQLHLQ